MASGLTRSGIARRVAAGRLHRVHPGVFAVGHPLLAREGRWMAAVLACGEGALLSHRSAAALWGLRPNGREQIDVTIPRRRGITSRTIDAHRSRTLVPADRATVDGIPCTSVARTLVDLADVLDRRSLERVIERAEVLRVFDWRVLTATLDRAFGRHGTSKLHALLAQAQHTETLTRSELEERFLALCDAAGIERPRVNAWITLGGGEEIQVDFLWQRQRLVAETDGHATHATRQAFERDRRRDQLLQVAGFRVVRFTWRQVTDDPEAVTRVIRNLLAQR